MPENHSLLLKANLKQLRLPTVAAEFEKLAREAAEAEEGYERYLLRLTAALLDRLTHRCHIFEMDGESYRFRESMKGKKGLAKNKNGSKPK